MPFFKDSRRCPKIVDYTLVSLWTLLESCWPSVVSLRKMANFQRNFQLFNDQYSNHIETSQLICRANHLTGFYMMGTLVAKGLNIEHWWPDFSQEFTIHAQKRKKEIGLYSVACCLTHQSWRFVSKNINNQLKHQIQ